MCTSKLLHVIGFSCLVTLLSGCASEPPTRFVLWSKISTDKTSYLSKDKVPFRMDIPGFWKVFSNPTYNHIILYEPQSKQFFDIFEYDDGALRQRFYKSGFTEAQAIEEYYRSESMYQESRNPDVTARIISRNVEGPITPNLLWTIEGKNIHGYFLTMSKQNHLIAIAIYREGAEPLVSGEELLTQTYRSIRFVTPKQVDEIRHNETDGSRPPGGKR